MAGEFDDLSSLPSIFRNQGASASKASHLPLLMLNCLIAVGLNFASFETNRRVGALGITIAGNVKQILVVLIGFYVSGEGWTWARWIGILWTMCGTCWWVAEEKRMDRVWEGKNNPKEKEEEMDEP
jgi:hypothetical protein